MVMQSSTLKKLLFGIALCVMPMVLCGMNSARRVGSAKKTARILPASIEETMPRQIVPATAFQIVAAATTAALDRPGSPYAPMSSEQTKKIEEWVEKGQCVKTSVSFDRNLANVHDQSERVSCSAPVSGHDTPMQGISMGKMSSSSSCNSHLSQLSSFEDRLWSLERVVEDGSIEATESVVCYSEKLKIVHEQLKNLHEKLDEYSNLSEIGVAVLSRGKFAKQVDAKIETVLSRALMTLDCRQQCAQEKFSTVQQQLCDSSAALKIQKETTESLAQDLKGKDKKIETLETDISALALQLTRLQTVVQRQQRPWWKRFVCCVSQDQDDYEWSEEPPRSLQEITQKPLKSCLKNTEDVAQLPGQINEEDPCQLPHQVQDENA